jgi:hypothetical protein
MWLGQHTTICHDSRKDAAPLAIFHITSFDKYIEQLNAG